MELFSAGAGIVTGIMDRKAAQKAQDQQAQALKQMAERIVKEMDPALVNDKALQADIMRAKERLKLQGEIDPELLKQRRLAEQILTGQLTGIGTGAGDEVSAQAAKEALTVSPGAEEAKQKLIDAALQEITLGASLPPDVQAELMQAGLQQAGQVTGAATARGAGGAILQDVLGLGGLNLKAQRQDRAANLLKSASDLDAQRQQILQNLFPRLQQQQLQNIAATSGILTQSNMMVPEAGLGGSDIANVWLARVGALNDITGQIGNVQAQGTLAKQAATNRAISSGAKALDSVGGIALGGVGGILGGIGKAGL